MQGPLILVGNHIEANQQNGREQVSDFAPRQDYIEIAQRLGGTLVGYNLFDNAWYTWARQVEKRIKLDVSQAIFATGQSTKHNIIYSTSEKMAIPLAAFLSLAGYKTPHIMTAHKLSSRFKTNLFRIWPLHKTFHHIISDCRSQVDYATKQLGVPESKVDFIYHNVDHRFYRPLNVKTDNYILAVGREQRDYKTLLQAISGTDIRLIIVSSSLWSTSRIEIAEIGETTVLSHISYQELRTLYAQARLVVIPLFDVDYAAGNTTLLEAMAMAKPVIVSRIRGITDYVEHDVTGIYVSPGDVMELREAILSLWSKLREPNRLGTNARQQVEECMNLDIYVDKVAGVVEKVIGS